MINCLCLQMTEIKMVLKVQPACFVEKSVIWGVGCDWPSVMQLETLFKKRHTFWNYVYWMQAIWTVSFHEVDRIAIL